MEKHVHLLLLFFITISVIEFIIILNSNIITLLNTTTDIYINNNNNMINGSKKYHRNLNEKVLSTGNGEQNHPHFYPHPYAHAHIHSNNRVSTNQQNESAINNQLIGLKHKIVFHESKLNELREQLRSIENTTLHLHLHLCNVSNENKYLLDYSPLNYKRLYDRSMAQWGNDKDTPLMLGILDELLHRRASQWFSSSLPSCMHIKSAEQLEQRLELARNIHKRDCRRSHSLFFICVITKNDDIDLQEWLVWQIVIVGVHHIVVYMNDPSADNTEQVLKPFVDAGYVTAFTMLGAGRQKDTYPHCINLIKRKACYYPGYGNLNSTSLKDCGKNVDIDTYNNTDRPVWMAGFDTDDFLLDTQSECFIDVLKNYSAYNGLMLPWFRFGMSDHFLIPENKLVSEAFTLRKLGASGLDKAVNRVFFIKSMTNSHAALFSNNKLAVNETFSPIDWQHAKGYNLTSDNRVPRYRLHHYQTKSVEHLVKKWIRGVADQKDTYGRAKQRPLADIIGWFKGFAEEWKVVDKTALPMAAVVRTVLYGE